MSDSLMVIIGIFLAVILMFIFPLMSISERNDDMAQTIVQSEISEFVNKIAVAGKIRSSDYQAFVGAINATSGAPYEVTIEVQHFDDNFQSKVAAVSGDLVGENVRYSTYTQEIEDKMEVNANKEYLLKKGDNVIVTAKSTSQTMAQTLRTAFYRIAGKGTAQVTGSASAMVVNNGRNGK